MKKLFSYVVLFSCLLLLTSITVFAVTAPNVQYSDVATYSVSYYSSVSGKTDDAAFDLLCEWSESDPVDSLEITRNNYAASVTGLRDPFIDHPEFADMIWTNHIKMEVHLMMIQQVLILIINLQMV